MTDERWDRKRKRRISRTIRASCQSVTIFPRKINVEKSGGRRKHGREAKTWKGDTFHCDVPCCSKISNQPAKKSTYLSNIFSPSNGSLFYLISGRVEEKNRGMIIFYSPLPSPNCLQLRIKCFHGSTRCKLVRPLVDK